MNATMANLTRRGIHAEVVDALGMRIVGGELPPGTILDQDLVLAEYGVSRTVLREALKVLTDKGLIDARPRTGTFVTERRLWRLLDKDVMDWRARGPVDERLLLELAEVRSIIEPAAAAMAARRRSDQELQEIQEWMQRLSESDGAAGDGPIVADIGFHRAVLIAAGNELLERFEVILESALHARDAMLFSDRHDERSFVSFHQAVVDAIAAGDPELASRAMSELMAEADKDTREVLAARSASVTEGG